MAEKDKKVDQAALTRRAESNSESSTAAGLNAKNKKSTARGPYQILDGTWKEMEKIAGRGLDRQSPDDNDLAFQLYTKRSEKSLAQNGIEINPGNTYALHVFGPKGGIDYLKRMKSDPNGLSTTGMSAAVIGGNKPFFFDKEGKPRTNTDSYATLSSRVGGKSDPGAITAAKDAEKSQYVQQRQMALQQQQQQQQQQQEQEQVQAQQQQPEAEQQEQADSQGQQEQQQVPQQETSALSQASNAAGIMYNGDRNNPGRFILPEQPQAPEGVATSGDASMKAKTFAYGGDIGDKGVKIVDGRKIRATTGLAMNPNRDLISGSYDRNRINNVIKASIRNNEDPNTMVALAMAETGYKEDNVGHVLGGSTYGDGAGDMVRSYARKASKNGTRLSDTEALTNYNGRGMIGGGYDGSKGTGNKQMYGVTIPKGGIDMNKTKLYSKNVLDIRDNVTSKNKEISSMISTNRANYNGFLGQFKSEIRPRPNVGEVLMDTNAGLGIRYAYGGKSSTQFADGGELNNGMLNDFNEGGSHEENPNGGIPQGMSPEGEMNTVEEGETKMGQYVFSDRLKLDKADAENLYLPKETIGMTYADASKFINGFLEDNPFDIIIKRTATGQLDALKVGNDRARRFKEEQEDIVNGTDMDPEKMMQYSRSKQQEQEPEEEAGAEQMGAEMEAQQPQAGPAQQYKFGGGLNYFGMHQQDFDPNGGINSRSAMENIGRGDNSIGFKPGSTSLTKAVNPMLSASPGSGITGESEAKSGGPGADAYVAAAGTALTMGMEAFKKHDSNNLDQRIERVAKGGAAAKGAISGASAGAAFGPWGAAIGGVVGGSLGFIGAGRQNKAANTQDINISGNNFNKQFGENVRDSDLGSAIGAYGGRQRQFKDGGVPETIGYKFNKKDEKKSPFYAGKYARLPSEEWAGMNKRVSNEERMAKPENRFKSNLASETVDYSFNPEESYSTYNKNEQKSEAAVLGNKEKESVFIPKKTNSLLGYAGAAGALSNYIQSRKEKPRVIKSEEYSKYSTPNYYDESIIERNMRAEFNNQQQQHLANSGGSASAARAMSMAGNSESNKLKSDSYFKMAELNNAVRDKDQSETQRVQDANVGVRNNDYQSNLAEQDFVQGRREKARDNMYSSVEALGQEQNDRNLIFNMSRGYQSDGTYDPEQKKGYYNRAMDYTYSKMGRKRHAANGGELSNFYNNMHKKSSKEELMDYIKNKYNG